MDLLGVFGFAGRFWPRLVAVSALGLALLFPQVWQTLVRDAVDERAAEITAALWGSPGR